MAEEIQILIRPVDELPGELVAQIIGLVNRAYARHSWLFPNPRTDPVDFQDEAAGKELILLSGPGEKLIGSALIHPEGEALYLEMVAVDHELRGKGYGARLLQIAEDTAKQRGFTKLKLISAQEIGNVDYYVRYGFRVTSTETRPKGTWGSKAAYTVATMEKELK